MEMILYWREKCFLSTESCRPVHENTYEGFSSSLSSAPSQFAAHGHQGLHGSGTISTHPNTMIPIQVTGFDKVVNNFENRFLRCTWVLFGKCKQNKYNHGLPHLARIRRTTRLTIFWDPSACSTQ
jgi:hypothetical protein